MVLPALFKMNLEIRLAELFEIHLMKLVATMPSQILPQGEFLAFAVLTTIWRGFCDVHQPQGGFKRGLDASQICCQVELDSILTEELHSEDNHLTPRSFVVRIALAHHDGTGTLLG